LVSQFTSPDCIGTTMLRFCEMWTVCSNLLRPTSRSTVSLKLFISQLALTTTRNRRIAGPPFYFANCLFCFVSTDRFGGRMTSLLTSSVRMPMKNRARCVKSQSEDKVRMCHHPLAIHIISTNSKCLLISNAFHIDYEQNIFIS
jgi:hypothetical protein